jgi:tetratricopeptide (TPR) repeat protein
MDITECYRILQLTSTASLEDVKASYRRLARTLHPDVNPNNAQAQEQFIRVTKAYKKLITVIPAQSFSSPPQPAPTPASPGVKVTVERSPKPSQTASQTPPTASPQPTDTPPSSAPSLAEIKLKKDSYRQLEDFIKTKRFPRAIALIEALRSRLPNDPEVIQWQAIIYQRWGRQLITERKLNQARAYLKKALSTDPHNKSLWMEVERDFKSMERIY